MLNRPLSAEEIKWLHFCCESYSQARMLRHRADEMLCELFGSWADAQLRSGKSGNQITRDMLARAKVEEEIKNAKLGA